MIPYSLNTKIRIKIIVILVLCSVFFTSILENNIIQFVNNIFEGGWLKNEYAEKIFQTITGFTFPPFLVWSILYFFYSKICWKFPIIKSLHGIPDLNGTWEGYTINEKNPTKKRSVTVNIKQDWNRIMVRTYMNDTAVERSIQSFCECTIAAVNVSNGKIKLMYAYRNSLLGSTSYIGYNELQIEDTKIVGQYITTKPSKGLFEIQR